MTEIQPEMPVCEPSVSNSPALIPGMGSRRVGHD